MIKFDNGGRLVESIGELPEPPQDCELFLDFETSSGDPRLSSLNPWHHCYVAGFAFTYDKAPGAWYVTPAVSGWDSYLRMLLQTCRHWVNHNVKYDAHVAANEGCEIPPVLVDTVTLAKIIDSDRIIRGGYGLDDLSRDWLHEDIAKYENAMKPYLFKNKDYGRIPVDLIAPYACQDVLTNRRLWAYEQYKVPEQSRPVWDTEIALTRVLFDAERRGLSVDPAKLKVKDYLVLKEMLEVEAELAGIVGCHFRPNNNNDCHEVLCGKYGLPVLAWTNPDDENAVHNPSFDSAALLQYAAHPFAPQDVIAGIQRYRKLDTHRNLFITKFRELNVDGVLHSSYNQAVRTGRMSCKEPNMQQNDKLAKELIEPREGYAFVSTDYSQIEFRTIVHYIQDAECIAAYHANPDTDFHQWVADMIPMPRRPAKNVNFMMGYGGGERKCVKMLASNMEVVGELKEQVEQLIVEGSCAKERAQETFNVLCVNRAKSVYRKYHETLPNLRPTSYRASRVLQERGFVYNGYGRRRHLPRDKAHKAFNTLCQSHAADIQKERTVALAKRLREKGYDAYIVASVHDETVIEAKTELACNVDFIKEVVQLMESPARPLRVPIRATIGVSTRSWAEASSIAKTIRYAGDPFERG